MPENALEATSDLLTSHPACDDLHFIIISCSTDPPWSSRTEAAPLPQGSSVLYVTAEVYIDVILYSKTPFNFLLVIIIM